MFPSVFARCWTGKAKPPKRIHPSSSHACTYDILSAANGPPCRISLIRSMVRNDMTDRRPPGTPPTLELAFKAVLNGTLAILDREGGASTGIRDLVELGRVTKAVGGACSTIARPLLM